MNFRQFFFHVLHTHACISWATALEITDSESWDRANYSTVFTFYVTCLEVNPKCQWSSVKELRGKYFSSMPHLSELIYVSLSFLGYIYCPSMSIYVYPCLFMYISVYLCLSVLYICVYGYYYIIYCLDLGLLNHIIHSDLPYHITISMSLYIYIPVAMSISLHVYISVSFYVYVYAFTSLCHSRSMSMSLYHPVIIWQ